MGFGDAGADGGPDAGDAVIDAGDAGLDAGQDGGVDAGGYIDAGICQIGDGGAASSGAWLGYNSCIVCDPGLNRDGWTVFDAGHECYQFTRWEIDGPESIPISGVCEDTDEGCLSYGPGAPCDAPTSICAGGFCGDGGFCLVDQNLGVSTFCIDRVYGDLCAEGPCCLDAGIEGVPNGGGWCCGLIDGGVRPCLPSGQACYDTSDCCAGLSCNSHDALYGLDAGYGLCR